MFFKAEIDEDFSKILVELNKAEVQNLIWVSLPKLAETFEKKYSNAVGAYEYDPAIMLHQESNCIIKTDRLFPLFSENRHKEGLAKGHWLAIKHLLRQEGFSGFAL